MTDDVLMRGQDRPDPVVVTLDVPSASADPAVPPFLADPMLDLEDPAVRTSIQQQTRMDDSSYNTGILEQSALYALAAEGSNTAEIAATVAYEEYRVLHPDWPEFPPPGLKVAVDPQSWQQDSDDVLMRGQDRPDPVVVTLDVPSASADPAVPPFLADPMLDLEDPAVRTSIQQQTRMDDSSYNTGILEQSALYALAAEGSTTMADTHNQAVISLAYRSAAPSLPVQHNPQIAMPPVPGGIAQYAPHSFPSFPNAGPSSTQPSQTGQNNSHTANKARARR
ncbi:hypothetical protein [Streptomyces mirabilis]